MDSFRIHLIRMKCSNPYLIRFPIMLNIILSFIWIWLINSLRIKLISYRNACVVKSDCYHRNFLRDKKVCYYFNRIDRIFDSNKAFFQMHRIYRMSYLWSTMSIFWSTRRYYILYRYKFRLSLMLYDVHLKLIY